MVDLAQQQIEHELQNATGQAGPGATSKPLRVSTGKLRKPSERQQRAVMPAMKPRKVGASKNLRRLEGGPSRDTFDQLSSPERGKRNIKQKAPLDGPISPRRDDRNVAHQPLPTERLAVADDAPTLNASNVQKSHPSPRKQANGPDADRIDDDSPVEEEVLVRQLSSPSQALTNAIGNGAVAKDRSNGNELRPPSQGAEEATRIERTDTTNKRKARTSRSSKPVASSAQGPLSGHEERSAAQVIVPRIKQINRESLYPVDNDVTEAPSGSEVVVEPKERRGKASRKLQENPTSDDHQSAEPEDEVQRERPERRRKRRAVTPPATAQPRKAAKRSNRAVHLGQNHELFGQQTLLRQAYQMLDKIGWSYKDGEKYSQADVDLDDQEVISIKKLCRAAKSRLNELKALPENRTTAADPPEEITWICNEIRALGTEEDYFVDREKVNNIYFHLFPTLVNLVRDTIDCYGEMDKDNEELTPQRAITIHHLGVVAALLKVITSLYDTLVRKYCEPQKDLYVKQPVKQIIVALRNVQDRFIREIRRHREREQQKPDDISRAEAERLLEERHERVESLAKQRAEIREKWLRLHDERRHVDVNILPRWKIAHLRVPELESDRDGNGEPFERLEVFAPRIGPSIASTQKARREEWNAIELDALRRGLEEFAGPRLFVKIFRRHCKRGGALHRFNVTEIVTIAADMVEWIERRQQRYGGEVEEWVRMVKKEMWTKAKIHGSGQENVVDVW